MATPQNVIDIARAELGNDGAKYWNWYFGSGWRYVDGNSTPYCACFASWVLNEATVTCPGFPRAVAIDRRDDFGGRMIEPGDLKKGDPVGFDWDYDHTGDHIGLVVDKDGNEILIYTIEGNTSGGIVAEKSRYLSQVTIGVRPRYDGVSLPTGRIDVDGWCGPKTTKKWQEQLDSFADGVISGQQRKWQVYRRNVVSVDYSIGGSALVKKVQKICGVGADGDWGPVTTCGIQRLLKSWGYYTGNIDSDFAHHSVEALQQSLNDDAWANV